MDFSQIVDTLESYNDSLTQFMIDGSEVTGLEVDQFSYLFFLLLATPVGIIWALFLPYIPKSLKYVFSIAVSITMINVCLGRYNWIHSFIVSVGTFIIVKTLNYKQVPKFVFIFAIGYLSFSHIYRLYINYLGWSLDFTSSQMMLTQKVTMFAYCYADGKKFLSQKKNEDDKKFLSEREKKYMIEKEPGFIEFLSYIYFFPSFLGGPSLEFKDYIDYCDGTMFDDEYCKKKVPMVDLLINTFKKFIKIVLIAPFLFVFMNYLDPNFMKTDEFLNSPLLNRLFYAHYSIAFSRTKYYFGWSVAEMGIVACGFGYNGYDQKTKKSKWDRITHINILNVELGTSVIPMLSNWNISTHHWLKYYVFLRITSDQSRPSAKARIFTFITSAFWHGFYPGYYLFFVSLALIQDISYQMRQRLRPLFVKTEYIEKDGKKTKKETFGTFKFVYDFFTFVVTKTFVSYIAVPFLLLSWEATTKYYNTLYWIPSIIILVGFIVFKIIFPYRRPRSKTEKVKENVTKSPSKTKK